MMIKTTFYILISILLLTSCGGSDSGVDAGLSSKSPDPGLSDVIFNPLLFLDICSQTSCDQSRLAQLDLTTSSSSTFQIPLSNQYYRTSIDSNSFAHLGHKVFFSAQADMSAEYKIFEYDFDRNEVKAIDSVGEAPREFIIHDQKLYYSASTSSNGRELWTYDPETQLSELFLDINIGSGDSNPRNFISAGQNLYFTATDSSNGEELRELSPSEPLGVLNPRVADIFPGSNSGLPSRMKLIGDAIYFSAFETTNGIETWVLEVNQPIDMGATIPNPKLVADLESGISGTFPDNYVSLGDKVYFTATTSVTGDEIWEYDSATEATPTVIEVIPGASGSGVTSLYAVNNKLFFNADSNDGNGEELWMFDPAQPQGAGNPSMVYDLAAGGDSSSPQILGNYQDDLYFVAQDALNGRELRVLNTNILGEPTVIDYTVGSEGSEIKNFYLIERP